MKIKQIFKRFIRELHDECIYCGTELKIWGTKKSYCTKCDKTFD